MGVLPAELESVLSSRGAVAGGSAAAPLVIERYQAGTAEEYRAVRSSVGVIPRLDLGVLRVWGRDPVRMINGLITNDLTHLAPDRACYGAMLTPKGRIITDLRVRVREADGKTELLIDYPKMAEEALAAHLTRYVPPLFARWELVPDVMVIGLYGPRAYELAESLIGTAPGHEEDDARGGTFEGEPVSVITTLVAGGEPGVDVFVPSLVAGRFLEVALDERESMGLRTEPLGMAAFECLRIEAGRPRFGVDMDEETLPAEAFESTGQMQRAISFTKGCYTGQEVVVRIAHRGHVNRHLRGLLMGDAAPPERGTPLFAAEGGKEIGRVTSATAVSPLMDQTIALGYVRREFEPGAGVLVGSPGGPPARVVSLPFIRSE